MTDTLRPSCLAEYFGQERLKRRLQVMIDAALIGLRRFPHLLLSGPAGTGKTSLATVIAEQTGDALHTLTMPIDIKELERLVRSETGIFFFDELQDASRITQARLLRLLEFGELPTSSGEVIPNAFFTVIGATTDARRITAPLRDRFVVPTFEPYSPAEMGQIVASMAHKAGITLADDTVAVLARASTGEPRYALQLVEAARALTEQLWGIEPDPDAILDQAGFSPDGLTDAHFLYLEALVLLDTAGLPLLARHLRLHPDVCMDLERLLIRQCLIEYSGQGRRLTPVGRRRLRARTEDAA